MYHVSDCASVSSICLDRPSFAGDDGGEPAVSDFAAPPAASPFSCECTRSLLAIVFSTACADVPGESAASCDGDSGGLDSDIDVRFFLSGSGGGDSARERDGSESHDGSPRKVQKGQINALAKMLGALRR